MSEEFIVSFAAPTLAGIKTGNLFSAECADRRETMCQIRDANRALAGKGIRILPMRFSEHRVLLYVYRPARLREDLSDPEARELLDRAGYGSLKCEGCLAELVRRLRQFGAFPHEIGLFLSYPPEDVRGFMEHGGRDCKCVGCWKVYGDVNRAQCLFDKYKNCTEAYLRRFHRGEPLAALAVNARERKGTRA